MTEEGYHLPDEELVDAKLQVRWAPGAYDGVLTHHLLPDHNEEAARKAVELVLAYCKRPTEKTKVALYQHLLNNRVVSIADSVLTAVFKAKKINSRVLYDLAYWLATESPDREPVKFGIALLGLFQQPDNSELFQTLGRHDEFTLFCAIALLNSQENPEEALWTLGRNVTGWGRIHVVERLADTQNPLIKDWLLREGYRNSVMDEYLAVICARTGGLLQALRGERVDRELLIAAGDIIEAMINGGPAEGIDDYQDAPAVIELYLRHMQSLAETVEDFLHVACIKRYLEEDESKWQKRYDLGWTEQLRHRCRATCESILSGPEWPERIRAGLNASNESEFHRANEAAKVLGLDTWEIHWQRLQAQPTEPSRWYYVMSLCNAERIEVIVRFAEQVLDLSAIATGAAQELGLGPKFRLHSCLDYILQELGHYPGHGCKLIQAALKSPTVSNRNHAVSAIAQWPQALWTMEIKQALEQAASVEPDEKLRDRMEKLLRGESVI